MVVATKSELRDASDSARDRSQPVTKDYSPVLARCCSCMS